MLLLYYVSIHLTAPNDAPQDVVAVNVLPRLIELSWSPPPAETHNGEIVHYVVTTTEIQTGQITVTMSFNTQTTLGNLHPFYDYTIIVAAFTINIGPPSTSIAIQTLEDGEYIIVLMAIVYLTYYLYHFL